VWCSSEAAARWQWLHVAEWRHRPHERRGGRGRATWRGQQHAAPGRDCSNTPRLVGTTAACHAWLGRQANAATWRRSRVVPSKAGAQVMCLGGGGVLRLGGPAVVRSEATDERIRMI
jgi:hypothetical protein